MEFFSQVHTALRGPTGQPQTADETIARLADRLAPSTLLADRRAAVQGLKGLAKAHAAPVAAAALPGLLGVLARDAPLDEGAARAALECVSALLAAPPPIGDAVAGAVAADAGALEALCVLLADDAVHVRLGALQLLGALLEHRRAAVQAAFLATPGAAPAMVGALADKRELVRTGAPRASCCAPCSR
jgi:hypothetical protein